MSWSVSPLRWRRILAVASASSAVICAWAFVANPTGCCYEKMRHLSDSEYIAIAIDILVSASKNTQGSHEQYQTADQFLRLNQECCTLLRTSGMISFEVEVLVSYRERKAMPAPSISVWVPLDACGNIVRKRSSIRL